MAQVMNQGSPVGFITSVTGQVSGLCVNRKLDVEEVRLEVGDPVYAWDQLRTGPDGTFEVGFVDGSSWRVGPSEQVEVDPATLAREEPAQEQDEPLELALEEGIDFNALEPTAAGSVGPANDDGTGVVILDRGNESDPYQAFETPGFDTEGNQRVLDIEDVVPPEDPIQVALPAAPEEPLRIAEFSDFVPRGVPLKSNPTGGGGGGSIGGMITSNSTQLPTDPDPATNP